MKSTKNKAIIGIVAVLSVVLIVLVGVFIYNTVTYTSFLKENLVIENGEYKLLHSLDINTSYDDVIAKFDKEGIKYTLKAEKTNSDAENLIKYIVITKDSKELGMTLNESYGFVNDKLQGVVYTSDDLTKDKFFELVDVFEEDIEKNMPKVTDATDDSKIESDLEYVRYWKDDKGTKVYVSMHGKSSNGFNFGLTAGSVSK